MMEQLGRILIGSLGFAPFAFYAVVITRAVTLGSSDAYRATQYRKHLQDREKAQL